MKKLLLLILFFQLTVSKAQITFENQYSRGYNSGSYFRIVKLSSSGYKYVWMNDSNTIRLYNLNHTLFKTIQIPGSVGQNIFVFYLSEELFNTNPNDVEYFLRSYNPAKGAYCAKIYDESGNLLFSKDSVDVIGNGIEYAHDETFISFTPSGVKMILQSDITKKAFVYSLPGTLTCDDCTGGQITSIFHNNSSSVLTENLSNYPNPTSDYTIVEYTLPTGVNSGELVFYSTSGQEKKRFKVTSQFENIFVNTTELEAGSYYYQICTPTGLIPGKKLVVIR